jgi:hypothetical protein
MKFNSRIEKIIFVFEKLYLRFFIEKSFIPESITHLGKD